MNLRLNAANSNQHEIAADSAPIPVSARTPRLLEWLTKLTQSGFTLDLAPPSAEELNEKTDAEPAAKDEPQAEGWQTIAHICGFGAKDFTDANAAMPLTSAEIGFFRRNHRGTESHISRDFFTAQTDLPSPLAELYGLYRHRARIDAEATLFLAQSTNSMRVARTMADLLAIGAFANGLEYVSYLGVTYSVPCAFDTSTEIDCANAEALRRLAMPVDHPSHLLKLTPDEIGVLAASIAEKNALDPAAFLEKANILSEARQDVNRLPAPMHFATAVIERDLPPRSAWAARLAKAYARQLPGWVSQLPQLQELPV